MEDHEGERHRALLKSRVHRHFELLRVHVLGQRLVREHVAHRPRIVLVHGGGDGNGPVERAVLTLRQRDTALVAVEDRGPRDPGVGGDVDHLVFHVHFAPGKPVPVLVAGGETADLMLGRFEIKPGEENRRAKHLGEPCCFVLDKPVRIHAARRRDSLGVELVLSRTEDETLVEAHVFGTRLLHKRVVVAAAATARGDRKDEGGRK